MRDTPTYTFSLLVQHATHVGYAPAAEAKPGGLARAGWSCGHGRKGVSVQQCGSSVARTTPGVGEGQGTQNQRVLKPVWGKARESTTYTQEAGPAWDTVRVCWHRAEGARASHLECKVARLRACAGAARRSRHPIGCLPRANTFGMSHVTQGRHMK